ncbi:SecDF P1 head subdomain-containing protein [Tsukamurella ocularis]|uniref:SecDF P1 head subdomain-containing protein n=1 Tax=Tsukamurella ocularis TaxID=1970234 RepID=UPI0039EE90EE
MANRRGIRTATAATVLAVALTATAACGRSGQTGHTGHESPSSSAPPAAAALQLRLVTSAEPLGARACPTESPAPSSAAELCERTGPMLYRLDRSVTHSPATDATVAQQSGQWLVTIQLDDADTRAVAETTARNIDKQLAIVVGARVVSAPVIRGGIDGGRIQLAGGFTEQQARDLAHELKPS